MITFRPPCSSPGRLGFVLLATVGLAIPLGAETRLGASQKVITPARGTPMAGYYHERGADGVADDLYAKAMVLEQDGVRAAVVCLDLISTTRPMVERARAEIAKITGIPGDHVLITATHAHTGPELADRGTRGDAMGSRSELASQYSEKLPGLVAEAVAEAAVRLQPVALGAGLGREDRLAFNRRFYMRDGTVGWNPGKLNPDIVMPAGVTDPEVGVLLAETIPTNRQPKEAIATFVNFAMHPDTTGGSRFSADYPGALSRVLAGYKGPGMVTLFANGTCGNINHIDVQWGGRQGGLEEAWRIGVLLGGTVLQTYKSMTPVRPGPLRIASELVKLPLAPVSPEEIAQARIDVRTAKDNTRDGFMKLVKGHQVLDVAARDGRPLEVEVQVITLGSDLAWVSLPGEVFVEIGLAIKKRSPFRFTFLAELANGSIGYIPDRRSYPEGNYEPVSARCGPGSGEILADTAARLLTRLHKASEGAR